MAEPVSGAEAIASDYYGRLESQYELVPDAEARRFWETVLVPARWLGAPEDLEEAAEEFGLQGDPGVTAFLSAASKLRRFIPSGEREAIEPNAPALSALYNAPPSFKEWTDFLVAPAVPPLKKVPYPPPRRGAPSEKAPLGKPPEERPREAEILAREEAILPTESL